MTDVKSKYPGSAALTVTNLHSLASSQDYLNGWSSGAVDNTSNLYLNYAYGFNFTSHASNRIVGAVYVYVIAALAVIAGTPTWPASATGTPGTEGALSFVDSEERDAACVLLVSKLVDTSASSVIQIPPLAIAELFGFCPPYHCLYITQNFASTTSAGLAAAGSAVYQTPYLNQF